MEQSYFSQLLRTVNLGSGNSITLRALTFGERQELQSRCMTVSVVADKGKKRSRDEAQGEVSIDAPLMTRLTWQRVIVDWSGPGFEGKPVTPENIDLLPPGLIDRLASELESLEMDAEAKND